jgi:hypothetical protein
MTKIRMGVFVDLIIGYLNLFVVLDLDIGI